MQRRTSSAPARRARDYGIRTGQVVTDMSAVRQRKRDMVASFRNGSQHHSTSVPSVDLIFGAALLSGPRSASNVAVLGANGAGRSAAPAAAWRSPAFWAGSLATNSITPAVPAGVRPHVFVVWEWPTPASPG